MDERLLVFSRRVKLLRDERNWSQQELADKLGTSKSLVSYYENSQREPGYFMILNISKVFGVDVAYIMGETDMRNK